MLDHITYSVPRSQYENIITWYLAALAPLQFSKQIDLLGHKVCLGPSREDLQFWIAASDTVTGTGELHFAFIAKNRESVYKFHETAVQAGGKDNGKPGLRTQYHPNYFAAFVLDPLG